MVNVVKSLKVSISLILVISSINLAGCGKRISPMAIQTPAPTAQPSNEYIPDSSYYDNSNNSYANTTPTPGVPNTQAGSFKVDQDLTNQWSAKGIAVSGGTIYVSASDSSGLFKKGTVLKMNSSDGKGWKDLGGKWLGLKHPMDGTVLGLAVNGGTIIAVDSASKFYTVDASSGDVKVLKTAGGTDVTAGGGAVYFANGSVEKSDSSGSSRAPINGLSASAGIGADNLGNVYAINGNTIKKADPQGQVMDIVTTDLAAPIDVAVDSRSGDLYVLESTMIKRFNSNGQLLISFANGASKPAAIAVDESGAVYVADTGSTYKDSKVIKFAAAVDAQATTTASSYGSYGVSSAPDNYSTYTTKTRNGR